ncbi:Swt1 family HEPN domain-containing protein [Hallella mizrahii]|uniref:Swt1-like HEPN domain-containing protein n=1 Tax=Hallella mizrahii TaxID=2606637 RepID=A0A7K0KE05_9BACT|nr:Swt1 family HEPN domain-containing protein [Hallella mizrahii]MST83715.1 hypothetical protein [Hallella mizrahii]
MEFTYQLPDKTEFLQALLTLMSNSPKIEVRMVYNIIKYATLEFRESTEFSQKVWNAYKLYITLRLPIDIYSKQQVMLEGYSSEIKNIAQTLLPADCGYYVWSVDIVPAFESARQGGLEVLSSSQNNDKLDILDKDIVEKGKKMSDAYLVMYCLENLLRDFIDRTLTNNYGQKYEEKITIANSVKNKVKSRINDEAKNKWLPLRGDSYVYYLDFNELGDIISNNWNDFKELLPSQEWIKAKVGELYNIRCLIAHNSYLDSTSIEVLNVDYKQMIKQIGK